MDPTDFDQQKQQQSAAQPESAESEQPTTDSEQQPPEDAGKTDRKPKPKPLKRTKHEKRRPPKPEPKPSAAQEKVDPPKPPAKTPSVSIQVPRGISPIPEVTAASATATGSGRPSESTLPRQSSLVSEPEMVCGSKFKPWTLITVFSVHWIASFAILIVGLAMTLMPPNEEHSCHVYFVVVYLRMAYWVGTYVQHELIKDPCRRLVNQNYNLYMDMFCYRKAPLKVVSLWNCVLIAAQSYVVKQFHVKDYKTNICSRIGPDMTPQLFILIFCGMETIMLGIFYVPAIKRLLTSLSVQDEEQDAPNGTLSNQDEIPINRRLLRQADQLKILTVANQKLRREALDIGALE